MWLIIGIIIGIIINHTIILPIEREQARKWCKQRGIVPEEDNCQLPVNEKEAHNDR